MGVQRRWGDVGAAQSASGLIASGGFVAYCVAALAARSLVGSRGARLVLWLSAVLAAAGAVVVAVSWSAVVLAMGVLVAGNAAGAATPALVVAVASTMPHRSAPRGQAVVNAGTGVGIATVGVVAILAPSVWRPVWALAAVAVVVVAARVDRRTCWPEPPGSALPHQGAPHDDDADRGGWTALVRPVLAAGLAGAGSAAVWTFGRELLASTGGLPERTTATLWVLLGVAAVLGAFSGDIVRVLGLRRAWVLTALLSATGTAVLALAAVHVVAAGVAAGLFGGSYTALSGVLIAWAGALRPHLAGATTATLFISLTAGQAVGSAATGALAGSVGPTVAFMVSVALLVAAAGVLPRRAAGSSIGQGPSRHDVDR
ncbi:MFS transporter [Actinotalea sp. K2]|uniref:MFS transporter n=1 Tax=Actinotalea sp. K2 TaxID=2939438 RepID=UPI002016E263|nr:MFS transporter [Actinotalea sp. K2]MCL3862526.1 MFS transporter [Actinotalea sp. K2]